MTHDGRATTRYDVELDFSSDTMNLFSPDHCPGHVVYWKAPVVAAVPISLENWNTVRDGPNTNKAQSAAIGEPCWTMRP